MKLRHWVVWLVLLVLWGGPLVLPLVEEGLVRGWLHCLSVFLLGIAIPVYSMVVYRSELGRHIAYVFWGWLAILIQGLLWWWLDERVGDSGLGILVLLSVLYVLEVVTCSLVLYAWRYDDPDEAGGYRIRAVSVWRLIFAVMVPAAVNLLYFYLSTEVVTSYGLSLFVLSPAVCGLVSPILYNWGRLGRFWESLLVAFLTGLASLLTLLMLGWEGLICMLMAVPVILPLTLIGGAVGHLLSRLGKTRSSTISVILLLLTPFGIGWESVHQQPHAREVSTTVVIDGTLEEVWREVIAFSVIPEPEEWYFRMGIAYPIRAEIHGEGVGAVRYCHFSTGAFVEPITHWEENRLLAFTVTEQPDPMIEVSPYARLHPPHLDSAFLSQRGQFLLRDLGNGQVELTGTTWYLLVMDPVPYWGALSDQLIHKIHSRVLRHIQTQVERGSKS
jgi:hypothetical protein